METVLYAMAVYILLGAAGMAIGARNKERHVVRERWLKYATYLLIVSLISASILLQYFFMVAILISIVSLTELRKAAGRKRITVTVILVFFIFLLTASGLIYFSFTASTGAQFYLCFLVFTFDAFCQVIGQILGRNHIDRRVSPGKTWEGFAGGTFFCCITAVTGASLLPLGFLPALVFGLLVSAAAFTGDMLASAFKRRQGIKDYSTLLPGQGGFLDRFDSLFMAGAMVAVLSAFSGKI